MSCDRLARCNRISIGVRGPPQHCWRCITQLTTVSRFSPQTKDKTMSDKQPFVNTLEVLKEEDKEEEETRTVEDEEEERKFMMKASKPYPNCEVCKDKTKKS